MVELNFVQIDNPGHPHYFLDQDGFMYRHTKKGPIKTYLICQKKIKFGCRGTAVVENGLLCKNKPHTCLGDLQEVRLHL